MLNQVEWQLKSIDAARRNVDRDTAYICELIMHG